MAKCRGCGAEALRTLARYDEHGDFIGEDCVACNPALFQDKFRDPSDRRMWDSYEVEPERYYPKDANGIARAKDELRQDTLEGLRGVDEDEEWREKKRKTRRTEPLTPDEIKVSENFAREQLIPAIVKAQLNQQYAHQED